jgi:hypothetical protein
MKSKAKSNVAKDKPRNELGFFVSTKSPVKSLDLANANSDDNIVDIKVKNPLHKIVQILQDIKSHQSTSFNMHFSIPLVALPIFLLALFSVFQLGRAQVSCLPTFTSKIGTLKTINVLAPKDNGFFSNLFSFFPSLPRITAQDELENKTKSLLIGVSEEPISIIKPDNLDLLNFEGNSVIVSGNFSQCTNSITLDNKQNISLLH